MQHGLLRRPEPLTYLTIEGVGHIEYRPRGKLFTAWRLCKSHAQETSLDHRCAKRQAANSSFRRGCGHPLCFLMRWLPAQDDYRIRLGHTHDECFRPVVDDVLDAHSFLMTHPHAEDLARRESSGDGEPRENDPSVRNEHLGIMDRHCSQFFQLRSGVVGPCFRCVVALLLSWLADYLLSCLFGWLASCLARWLVAGQWVGWLAGWPAGCLAAWWLSCIVG